MKRRKSTILNEWRRLLSLCGNASSLIESLLVLSFCVRINGSNDDGAKLIVRPDSSTVPVDTRVSFFCRADGNPMPPVVWKRNGQSLSDPRYVTKSLPNGLSTLRIEPVRLADGNSTISCSADNGVGSPVVADAHLTVLPIESLPSGFPVIEAHPVLKSVEQGRTAHVSCRVRGDPRPKVLWLRDLMPIDVRSNNRYSVSTLGNPGALMIQQAREEDQGKYECVARNTAGVIHSKAAHLYVKVRRVPPYFSYKLERLYKVGPGGAINLTCVAVGYPMPRVFWKKSDDTYLNDPQTAPIGKNVLTLTRVEQTENYTCIAVSKLGNIEATTMVEVRALPPAPRNLRIIEVTADSVAIRWDELILENEPVKSYLVRYRQKYGESSAFKEKQVPAEVTNTIITNLEPYQLYEISVLAVNAIGKGTATMPKEVQTGELAPSSPPQKVQARALNRNSILVRWDPPEKPNGLILGYKIYYTNLEVSTPYPLWKMQEVKADEMITTLYNLETERTYYIHVQARNSKGLSPMSQLVTVITKHGIPGQPSGLSARALDSKRVQLSWEKPLHSFNIVGYSIRFNSSTGIGKELTLTSPIEKHIIDGLEPNTLYSFRVAAQSARGLGAYCEEVNVRTNQSVPTGAPKIVDIESVSSKALMLKWEPPAEEQRNGALINYAIRWRLVDTSNENISSTFHSSSEEVVDDNQWEELIRSADQETQARIDGLDPFTIYEVSVAAGTEKGFGPSSETVRRRTAEDVPSAPRDIEVVQVNASAVKVSWERPAHANGDIIGYYVYKDKLLNGEPVNDKLQRGIIYDQHKTHTLITDLEPNTEYSFRVNAFNRHGDGEFSASKKILTGGLPPSEPVTQSVTLLNYETPLRARVNWKPPRVTYNLPINKYVVWYKPQEHIAYRRVEVPGTQNYVELDDLMMGRLYEISVAAENDDGLSANATESLTTPVGIPEAEPLNVRYEVSDGQMTVSWDAPAIDQRNGNITYYRAILTPLQPGEQEFDQNVTSARSVTYDVSSRKAYTFKVAAATMKGLGPYSPVLSIDPDPAALVSPPNNIRVQATSNSSAVVQWDFDGESVDGFVVKYIHEPSSGQRDSERWKAMTIMDPSARHLHIAQLTTHKPYAFCVLAIRQNRQGACSDPPTTIDRLMPTHMVSNLVVAWKTSNSVMLKWDYSGPQPIGFYVNQTGRKDYFDQHLQLKGMVSPGFRQELDGRQREHLWTTLRPYMEYTFHVGVRELPPSEKEYWPQEKVVRTDPAGPPFVDVPEFLESQEAGTALIRLRCASEEYGPISHYWLIVVPGNFTQDDVLNLDSSSLQKSTAHMKPRREHLGTSHRSVLAGDSGHTVKKARKANKHNTHNRRFLHEPRMVRGAYIAAGIPVLEMQQMQRDDRPFPLGDGQIYDGYENWPLDSNSRYRLMMRAFAREDSVRNNERPFEYRAPMQEPLAKRYSDSMLSEPFSTKMAAHTRDARASNLWLIAPLVAVLIIALIVGMLVIWWLRCNKKGSNRGANRHGSITKVALAGSSIPSETSKLLVSGDVYGRQVMNPYDQMNANGGCAIETSVDMYPLHQTHHPTSSATTQNYSSVPVPMPLLPSSGGVVGGHTLSHPPIPISELAAHIEKLKLNNNALFQQEYESIETGQHFTWDHSNMDENKSKNRYANVVAYDHSRVVLNVIDAIPNSDYINANYVDGYEKAKAYIATQGPLPETFADFWRMVWEENSVTIVMLTKLEERNRIKCDQYWPTRGSSLYGSIQVTLLETLELAHYTIRTMRLQHRGSTELRDVKHLQYTAWPDHGVPDHPTPFLMFLKRVKTLNHPDAGPIISHCSAGIGRTGAFIVIDCMLERLRYENTVDIYGCVTALRSQRSYMVQTEDQYIFIHDSVLDAVLSGSTEVPAGKLYTHIQALLQIQPVDQASGMELEFRHLATLKMLNSRCVVANLPVNRPKNRLVNMVPYDSTRVILHAIPGLEGSDYINASWIDGYRQRGAYIATQGPLPHTANDFWRMIWECESSIVVMMIKTREMGREKCCEYWPAESGAQFGQLVIEPIAEYNMPQYVLREFRITDTQSGQTRTIRHFQYTEWPEQGPPKSAELFIDFIHQVHRTKTQFGVEGPITVHCSTGASRTGVFIALSIIIDRMKLEHVVDVFTTVKLLRTERQNMVQDKEQYHFCYQAALEFLATYDNLYQMQ